ncbi:CvfB family protein [Thalassotalea marina]|uniref:GntR family transcriptional regulator n=1 Tax=Thalassotalea marina TaxID=1673741 RepID=A0A919EIJ6_9GAMM|nr:S1-like domain-containing RNA-binding protein [Thalassotalea marina]GHF82965.1 GntR family transcriptional regulator [Thalassotalea marina]
MTPLGQFTLLTIKSIVPQGAMLDTEQFGEVLLPNKFINQDLSPGDAIEALLYRDGSDRICATTEVPLVQAGQFASLKVKQVNKLGAFLDWGMPKDILVPPKLQLRKMEQGKSYLVYVYLDEHTQKLVATSKIEKFIDIWPADYTAGQTVDIIIGGKTDLGFKAIINHKHWGLIYRNEVFKPLRVGQQLTAYIKQVREDDRIDLSLSRAGKHKVKDFESEFIDYLTQNNGFSHINDKSSPADISQTFGVSKKTFKATVGHLLKKGKIELTQTGIQLK